MTMNLHDKQQLEETVDWFLANAKVANFITHPQYEAILYGDIKFAPEGVSLCDETISAHDYRRLISIFSAFAARARIAMFFNNSNLETLSLLRESASLDKERITILEETVTLLEERLEPTPEASSAVQ